MLHTKRYLQSISTLQGVGPELAKKLKLLGIHSLMDAILHFPSNLAQRQLISRKTPVSSLSDEIIIEVTPLFAPPKVYGFLSHSNRLKIPTQTVLGPVDVFYFNGRPQYFTPYFQIDKPVLLMGTLKTDGKFPALIHPEIIKPQQLNSFLTQPIYPSTTGLTQRRLGSIIHAALNNMDLHEDWLPEDVLTAQNWPSFHDALHMIHNPRTVDDVLPSAPARQRIACDELIAQHIQLTHMRQTIQEKAGFAHVIPLQQQQRVTQLLPFQLTDDQRTAIDDINKDMHSPTPMVRLLQGDVGSGKTIVAFHALINAGLNDRVGCFMSPTEILTRQHFTTLSPLCSALNIPLFCLTSQSTAKDKRALQTALENNTSLIVLGTQALLFQKPELFAHLSCVVIDEQHRFGVAQRLTLLEQDNMPDCLVMSATPIPRTMLLTVMGDIAVSELRQKPVNRKPIDTRVMSHERILEFVHKLGPALEKGQKAFWICPLIEENEALNLMNVTDRFAFLQKHLPHIPMGLIHGRMPAKTRDPILQQFRDNHIRLLVSTTVIEVGIDVPDATILIIDNAERFGLAQLHQLRGRVGRGDQDSYCVLMYGQQRTPKGQQRLQTMKQCHDGFALAEADLQMREGGNILGTQQSGITQYRCVNWEHHYPLMNLVTRILPRINPVLQDQFITIFQQIRTEQNIIAAG